MFRKAEGEVEMQDSTSESVDQGNVKVGKSDAVKSECKVLRISWNRDTDVLKFPLSEMMNVNAESRVTKRSLLSTLSKILNHLELVSPI